MDKAPFKLAQKLSFEHLDEAFKRRVYPSDSAIDNLAHFDEDLAEEPTNAIDIINQLHEYGSPATLPLVAGRYFGFVNGSYLPAAMAAKNMASFWDQNTALHVISPICSKLEEVVEKWLKDLFKLPEETAAGFVSGSSVAIYCALAAGRMHLYEKLGWDVNAKGLYNAPKIRIIAGKQIHATVKKAIALLGLGLDHIEWVATDAQGRIMIDEIPPLDDHCILCLQAGDVGSGAFDDFSQACKLAKEAGAWVHIDGAFGLWARCCKQLSHLCDGMELADSWSVDGHKTLNTPYDSGIVLCKHKDALVKALQASGSYIVYGPKRDGMLYTPEMSRRSRVVELWAALKSLGKEGVDRLVLDLHERTKQFASMINKDAFETLNQVHFNQLMIACKTDAMTENVLDLVQRKGVCWAGPSKWNGRKVIRISICAWTTTEEDIDLSVESFNSCFEELYGNQS